MTGRCKGASVKERIRAHALSLGFSACGFVRAADVPDNGTAMAMAATIGASGAISSYETVVLLTPAEVDAAMRKSVDYRAPGA